jgi:hypothetical protein
MGEVVSLRPLIESAKASAAERRLLKILIEIARANAEARREKVVVLRPDAETRWTAPRLPPAAPTPQVRPEDRW